MPISALVFSRPGDIQALPRSIHRIAGEYQEKEEGEEIGHGKDDCGPYRFTDPGRVRPVDQSAEEEENGDFGEAKGREEHEFSGPRNET